MFNVHLMFAASLTYSPQPKSGGDVTVNEYVQMSAIAAVEPNFLRRNPESGEVIAIYHSKANTINVVIELIPASSQRVQVSPLRLQ